MEWISIKETGTFGEVIFKEGIIKLDLNGVRWSDYAKEVGLEELTLSVHNFANETENGSWSVMKTYGNTFAFKCYPQRGRDPTELRFKVTGVVE